MIKTESIKKVYTLGDTKVTALDNVNIEIKKGEMIALTGSSGSGKSTLMHILGCLDSPDSGRYFLNEEDISKLTTSKQAEIRNLYIGFVFQTFNLLPRLTALENVELPLLYGGKKKTKDKAKAALELVGLKNRFYHEPNQLSGGQRQRVAIARAMVTEPTILLADEPTGNLDSKTGEEIISLFTSLNTKGQTIVMVTHENDVAKFCKREIKMKDGKVVPT